MGIGPDTLPVFNLGVRILCKHVTIIKLEVYQNSDSTSTMKTN